MATSRFLDRRYDNPVTWSMILHDKNIEMMKFLYGTDHWSNKVLGDIYRDAHFNLETILPTPENILQRHTRLQELRLELDGEDDEEKRMELFRDTLRRDGVPNVEQWKLHALGFTKSYDVSSKMRWLDDGEYFQLTFAGYSTVPVTVIMELISVGLAFDLYWFNHATMEFGGFSVVGNENSKYLYHSGRTRDDIVELIFPEWDLLDSVAPAKALLWLYEIILAVDDGMKNFITNHPKETWYDDNAKIFFIPQPGTEEVAIIENLLGMCQVGVPLSKKSFWKAEMATLKIFELLNPSTNKEVGFLYYRLESTVRYVKEEIEKLIAEG